MKNVLKRMTAVLCSVFMLMGLLPTVTISTAVSAATMPAPADDNFTILWTTDPQWYSFAYPEIIEHQNDWVVDNYAKLDMRYIVHTGDFVDNPNSTEQWSIMDTQYKKWDNAGLAYGILAGNHDVSGSDHSNFSKYFGEARYNSKPWYGGSYEDNFGHYDLMTIDGIDFIFVYMGYNSSYKQADYDWLNSVLAAYPDRIAMLGFHDYLYANGKRSANGEQFFQKVILKNPNVRMVMCGHNYNSTRLVEDVDDNGDGKADRTVYQLMANYQSTTNGGNGFMRFMECSPKNGTITMRTYSPYTGNFGSDYEDGTVLDEYGYRDEFVIPFDFSAPTVKADGSNGDIVTTPTVGFTVNGSATAKTLGLAYQNAVESGSSFNTAGVYDRHFSFNAADAYSSPRSLNYITVTYTPGIGYAVSKITKGSSLTVSNPFVPIPQNGVVIAVTSGAVDVNSIAVGSKVFLKAPVIQTPTAYKTVTLYSQALSNSFNVHGINCAVGTDEWVIYDDETKNAYANVWNMLFAFAPVNGSSDRYAITAVNTTGGTAKRLTVPQGGFVLAVNTYSATSTFTTRMQEYFKVGFEVILNGHTPGKPNAYTSQSFLPSSASGWKYDSSMVGTADENGAQAIYKLSGSWPNADYDFASPITIDPSNTAFYYDYMLETDGKNNIILFFKNSNTQSSTSKECFSVQAVFEGAVISPGSGDVKGDDVRRTGKVDFTDMAIPDTCYNDDGTLTLNAIRVMNAGADGKKLYLYDMGITTDVSSNDAWITLMDPETLSSGNDASKAGTYVYDNGKLTVESLSDNGYEVEFALNKSFDVTTLKNWLIDVSTTAPFDVKLTVTTSGADAEYGLVSEFRPAFCESTVNGCIPAGDYVKSFELLGCYTWNNVLPANGITTVKKVTIVVGGKGTLTLNALQMGSGTTAGTFADGVRKTGGSLNVFETTYTLKDGFLSDVSVNTTVSAFMTNVTSDYTVTIKENGTAVSGNTLVKTGQTLTVTSGGTVIVSYTIVVLGDVDQNGQSSTSDARLLLGYALGVNKDLSGVQKLAGDLNEDGDISTTDARVILQGIVL